MIAAGRYRDVFLLQAHTQELDTLGDAAPSENDEADWATSVTFRGEFRGLVGSERIEAMRESAETTGYIFTRYRASGFTPDKRIKWTRGGVTRKFNILAVDPVDEELTEMRIMVKEVRSSGLPHGA